MEDGTALPFVYSLGGYAGKLTHLFGAVIWIGGVLFMAGVATPILEYYNSTEHHDPRVAEIVGWLERRLIGFNWLGLGAVFVSGLVLSIYANGFDYFRFATLYDWVISLKVFLFLPVASINYLLGVSYRELADARSQIAAGEDLSPRQIVEWRIVSLRRLNIWLAFALIILVALL
jgi:uncharacterized membrane protein